MVDEAVDRTLGDLAKWASALWDGREPDLEPFNRRVFEAMSLGMMAGFAGVDVSGPVDRHADETFREMVEALMKKKSKLFSGDPRTFSDSVKQTSFFVAGVTSGRALDGIKRLLAEARVRGKSKSWFQQQVRQFAKLEAKHVETVFRTNVESAAGAGRWKQYNDPDVADLFYGYTYVSRRSEHTRPLHRLMHGFSAVKDDPVWPIVWTPNGFNCQCKVRPLRLHQAKAVGIVDGRGRVISRRIFANPRQEEVVLAAESGSTVIVGRKALKFPDEGFRGNALKDLI